MLAFWTFVLRPALERYRRQNQSLETTNDGEEILLNAILYISAKTIIRKAKEFDMLFHNKKSLSD